MMMMMRTFQLDESSDKKDILQRKNANFNIQQKVHTLRSTTVSGKPNSPIIQSGMAPPHGFALSILRSKKTVSIFFSCAKISAAQAPDGPPPTTATLYFISNDVDDDVGTPTICLPTKDDGVKATAVAVKQDRMVMESFMVLLWCRRFKNNDCSLLCVCVCVCVWLCAS